MVDSKSDLAFKLFNGDKRWPKGRQMHHFSKVTLFMTSDYAEARNNITTASATQQDKGKNNSNKRDSCVKKKWHNIWPAGVFVWHTQYLRPLAAPQLLAKTDRYSTWKRQLSTLSQFFDPFSKRLFENLSLNFLLSENSFCQLIFSVIAVVVPPLISLAFRIQHAEHQDATHLLILLSYPLRVLRLRENVTSCLRNLSAKNCHPIYCSYFLNILFEFIIKKF